MKKEWKKPELEVLINMTMGGPNGIFPDANVKEIIMDLLEPQIRIILCDY
jgi:hypothetical protein